MGLQYKYRQEIKNMFSVHPEKQISGIHELNNKVEAIINEINLKEYEK